MEEKSFSIDNLDVVDNDIRLEDFVIRRIDELCKVNGLSRYRLGQLTGIAQSSLSTMMNGKTLPSLGTLDRLCEGLGISIFDFFNFDTKKVTVKSQEHIMMQYWNRLDDKQKSMLLGFAKGMLSLEEIDEIEKQKPKY